MTFNLKQISACMIKVQIENQLNDSLYSPSWDIGPCYGPKEINDDKSKTVFKQYRANNAYIDMCCLSPGSYTLRCMNDKTPFGWGKGFVEIRGQRYCDDFVGYRGLRRVVVEG